MNTFFFQTYTPILQQFGINQLEELLQAWSEPHRYYHTLTHLQNLLTNIDLLKAKQAITQQEYAILVMAAFFHDIVYNPKRQDNEPQSVEFLRQRASPHPDLDTICQIILDTQTHQPNSYLSELFIELDMKIVAKGDFQALLQWEKAIMKEYQYLDYGLYLTERKLFLEQLITQYPQNAYNLRALIDYLTEQRPRIGVYAGSFNPFHNGHYNILQKAEKIFDKVIVARGVNPDKLKQESIQSIHQLKVLAFRQTEEFTGLLTDYLKSKETFADITLIRGLRNGYDLDYEVNQLRFMEEMKPDLKIVFIPCDSEFEHISSSAIKNLERINQGLGKKYLPE
ncbi:MAG: adenylyltransferase/cytidyltransferase family protein [Microscillaceae bacterium]|nr:adenylyltransferase/cytidyltransferase family protein [Microscillaceae bacterium]MDW8459933.1 adenylyltransferase/cytidyltransferase family protein [Cytophagales bacterium]